MVKLPKTVSSLFDLKLIWTIFLFFSLSFFAVRYLIVFIQFIMDFHRNPCFNFGCRNTTRETQAADNDISLQTVSSEGRVDTPGIIAVENEFCQADVTVNNKVNYGHIVNWTIEVGTDAICCCFFISYRCWASEWQLNEKEYKLWKKRRETYRTEKKEGRKQRKWGEGDRHFICAQMLLMVEGNNRKKKVGLLESMGKNKWLRRKRRWKGNVDWERGTGNGEMYRGIKTRELLLKALIGLELKHILFAF